MESGTKFDEPLLQKLYRYCYSLSACPDAAYDLLHDALERYLVARPADDTVNIAYLKRIIRNRQFDIWRKESRVHEQTFEEDSQSDAIYMLDSVLASVTVEDQLDIASVLRTLDPTDREILYHWAYEDKSTTEIAGLMDMPRGTILSRMHRLKQRVSKLNAPLETAPVEALQQ